MRYDGLRFIRSVKVNWSLIDQDSYLRRIDSIRSLNDLEFDSSVTLLTGENGTGKSTLLEAIAVAYGFNGEGGTLNYRFSTYDDVSELGDAMIVSRERGRSTSSCFLRAESFFNVATKAQEYGTKAPNLHHMSHGESVLTFLDAFNAAGLYLMDEPESGLSPQRQLSLLVRIHELASKGSQFIIATHSPILLGIAHGHILGFDDGTIDTVQYEQTESYRITELFLNHRDSLLHHILGASERQ